MSKNITPEELKQFGEWLRGGHDLNNLLKEGGRVVTVSQIASFLRGEWPEKDNTLITPQDIKIPKSEYGQQTKDVFKRIDTIRGYRPPKRKAEAASILRMLNKGFTADQIINTWQSLKQQQFWQDKELFMMSLESQIGALTKKPKADPDKYIKGKYGHRINR